LTDGFKFDSTTFFAFFQFRSVKYFNDISLEICIGITEWTIKGIFVEFWF